MLGQNDVGHRVVVRRIVGVRDGRPQFSDSLGELIEWSTTHLTVATAGGPVRVPLAEVHRAKRVPDRRRPIGREITALELAANEAWPAPIQEPLGQWLLRAADGWTGRANSALVLGHPDRSLPEAVDAVEQWYAARGQTPLIDTPLPTAAAVGTLLDGRGWGARPGVLVQTASLPDVLAAAPPVGSPAVRLASEPDESWLAIVADRKGGLPPGARHPLTAVGQVSFAHVYDDHGDLLAIGRGSVTGDGRWLGLTLVEVVPAARRRGLARQVIGALASWGAEAGATDAFLQVEEHNTAAVALYAPFGFQTHHTYVIRVAPGR